MTGAEIDHHLRGKLDDEVIAVLTLMDQPGMGPSRLRWLLATVPATEAVAALTHGRLPPEAGPPPAGVNPKLVQTWTAKVRRFDLSETLARLPPEVDLIHPGSPTWPFAHDPDPPVLLFAQGDQSLLDHGPVVVVVGTRRCTSIGRKVASQFGAELARHGVVVASGLASGIDGAAHRGALAAHGPVIGVVGTGLDVVYPAVNRSLWRQVGREGLLLSEAPPGAKPERWRFPARNRLLAGLADLVLVVESHDQGGSLLTVNEALDRGVPVMAVPGAVTSPASAGTNQLLIDGCPPACTARDVLDALGVDPIGHQLTLPVSGDGASDGNSVGRGVSAGGGVSALGRAILGEAEAGAVHVDDLARATSVAIPRLLSEITILAGQGLVVIHGSTVSLPDEEVHR